MKPHWSAEDVDKSSRTGADEGRVGARGFGEGGGGVSKRIHEIERGTANA